MEDDQVNGLRVNGRTSLNIDLDVLAEYSRFVDWEGGPKWVQVPIDQLVARDLGLNEHWVQCLSTNLPAGECVALLWAHLTGVVPRTVAALSTKTSGLAILRTELSGNSLIYLLGDGEDVDLRRGFSPIRNLPAASCELPVNLDSFYGLHNGFVHFMTYDGGLLPTSKWRTVIDPDSGRPSFLEVATDGSEGFGFDVSERPIKGYVLRPNEDEVRLIIDEWAFLDDLMARQIESIQKI